MAKIIYGMLVSLDGYIAAADGGLVLPVPETELHWYFNAQIKRTAVYLCGRRMYEVMRFWDTADSKSGATKVEIDFAKAWQETPKVVFSSTLQEVGPNARLARLGLAAEVGSLTASAGGDISVAGAGLAASLARLNLIDEYQLFLQPVVLGGGKPFFEAGSALSLKPLGSELLPQGVVLLRYAASS